MFNAHIFDYGIRVIATLSINVLFSSAVLLDAKYLSFTLILFLCRSIVLFFICIIMTARWSSGRMRLTARPRFGVQIPDRLVDTEVPVVPTLLVVGRKGILT